MLTDGATIGYLSLMAVAAGHRRKGVGRELIKEAFARSALGRLDVLAEEGGGESLYRSFEHRRFLGFRIYPDATN